MPPFPFSLSLHILWLMIFQVGFFLLKQMQMFITKAR
jgi:hypothetical protein